MKKRKKIIFQEIYPLISGEVLSGIIIHLMIRNIKYEFECDKLTLNYDWD